MTDLAALLAKLRTLPTQQVLVPPERSAFLASRVPGFRGSVTQDCVVVPSGVMGLLLDVVQAAEELLGGAMSNHGGDVLHRRSDAEELEKALSRLAAAKVVP